MLKAALTQARAAQQQLTARVAVFIFGPPFFIVPSIIIKMVKFSSDAAGRKLSIAFAVFGEI